MSFAEVPSFIGRLRERETWGRLALEAAILTAARRQEIPHCRPVDLVDRNVPDRIGSVI
jgi:hypothetical protein